jgi:hypothetical protein
LISKLLVIRIKTHIVHDKTCFILFVHRQCTITWIGKSYYSHRQCIITWIGKCYYSRLKSLNQSLNILNSLYEVGIISYTMLTVRVKVTGVNYDFWFWCRVGNIIIIGVHTTILKFQFRQYGHSDEFTELHLFFMWSDCSSYAKIIHLQFMVSNYY